MLTRLTDALEGARGLLMPFAATAMGIGIATWFQWPSEPRGAVYAAFTSGLAFGLALWRFGPWQGRPLAAVLSLLCLGFLLAGLRAQMMSAPVLSFRYYGPVEGRVVEMDRSSSDALRLTFDEVVLRDMAPERTPKRVRISLRGAQMHDPQPGETLILTAHLAAPQGPVEPGGFDFRRMAWFQGLGAVGYTGSPALLLKSPEPFEALIARMRMALSTAMRAHIPGDAGAFAAGAMTGDRSGISQETVRALRDSSLAHLLAISGMNLAFLVAFVFWLVRGGIALVPMVALRVNGKKISAVLSLAVAGYYLLLSGANVATERAFVMVAVVLMAVILDRRAITLRTAALAAMLLLALRPESLMEPGFQMSFAATVALVAGFKALDHKVLLYGWPRWSLPIFTLVASSVLGGFATAPYATATFNRFADYGLLANLLTVPVMGAVVMPSGAMAVLLAPLGLAWLALWVMEQGVRWILWVAHWVAGLEGAVTMIPAPHGAALPLITLGGIWLIAWPGRARLAGALVLALGLLVWPLAPRPDLLIADDGRLLGLMGPEGRALSRATGGGFAAENWLESDGDGASQAQAAERPGFSGPQSARRFSLGGLSGVALHGKAALEALEAACSSYDLVIIAARVEVPPQGDCLVMDENRLRLTGALAIWLEGARYRVEATRARHRLWGGKPMPPEALPDLNAIAVRNAQ
ncbi:ComEC/Rec2 family competence protein [Xinfangfangia sp. CPCC 101601]|uniref:ComEC/Rec2 family competence protein n=1 Tax=Pseudogemmobacter lacusdianii TaxID=3069608 RepID=A0ABU0W0N9_9RHOB|nr:ComEC/Rec2 family competence protein [Xinfangfangia sp. CPCC 101601]MDQ2067563.1 ComEC/Rec2 family competence protein [Xinfangfangia sp. CPCC 101601]